MPDAPAARAQDLGYPDVLENEMPRSTALALSATLALTGLTATACGSSTDADADGVRTTLKTYASALAAGDGSRACRLLTADVQRELATVDAPDALVGCAATFPWAAFMLSEKDKQELRDLEIRKVRIDGDRAIVRDSDITAPVALQGPTDLNVRPIVLERVGDGAWKIDDLG